MAVLAVFSLSEAQEAAPGLPFGFGAEVAVKNTLDPIHDSSSVLPFAFVRLAGIGHFKAGYFKIAGRTPDSSGISQQISVSRLQTQLNIEGIPLPGHPYFSGTWARVTRLSPAGDEHWKEWGIGLGGMHFFNTNFGFFFETHHKWISDFESVNKTYNSGTQIVFVLGFLVYIL